MFKSTNFKYFGTDNTGQPSSKSFLNEKKCMFKLLTYAPLKPVPLAWGRPKRNKKKKKHQKKGTDGSMIWKIKYMTWLIEDGKLD